MTPGLQTIWQQGWPRLEYELDALVLFAFRMLVRSLDERRFFLRPPSEIEEVRGASEPPAELTALLRTRDRRLLGAFAKTVEVLLRSQDMGATASLAFAVDLEFGPKLSRNLGRGDRSGLKIVARAVNAANRVLMEEPGEHKPVILVRSPQRYWLRVKNVVNRFPLPSQDTASNFGHLLPLETRLNRIEYSAVAGVRAPGLHTVGDAPVPRLTVALWPAQAPPPPFDTRVVRKKPAGNGKIAFRFIGWKDLADESRKQHITLANCIAEYIAAAADVLGTVHIIAAPELMLAPQAQGCLAKAIESRRNAEWIVLPGSYHIERGDQVVNLAPLFVGGALDRADVTNRCAGSPVAAIKHTPVVFYYDGATYQEDIDRTDSSVHVLDSGGGRIAVMICRDFLDQNLTNEVVSMGVDHLFVLSMSPDHGFKFETAMNAASNFQTATYFVNAFTGESKRAGYRKPLIRAEVDWIQPADGLRHCTLILEQG